MLQCVLLRYVCLSLAAITVPVLSSFWIAAPSRGFLLGFAMWHTHWVSIRFSGADLFGLVSEAKRNTLKRLEGRPVHELSVTDADFKLALRKVNPSVTEADVRIFSELQRTLRQHHLGRERSGSVVDPPDL